MRELQDPELLLPIVLVVFLVLLVLLFLAVFLLLALPATFLRQSLQAPEAKNPFLDVARVAERLDRSAGVLPLLLVLEECLFVLLHVLLHVVHIVLESHELPRPVVGLRIWIRLRCLRNRRLPTDLLLAQVGGAV